MKKDLNKLSFSELQKELKGLSEQKEKVCTKRVGVWDIGKNYVLRTVTMIQVGKLVKVTDNELVLEDAAWVADTGRWKSFLAEGEFDEAEPFPDGEVIVGRHSLIDACVWNHGVIRIQK